MKALAALRNNPEAKVGCPTFVRNFMIKTTAASGRLAVLNTVKKICSEAQGRGIDITHYSQHVEADLKRRVCELEVEINKKKQEQLRKRQAKPKATGGKRTREEVEEVED
jgi:hypothetical protein